MNRLVSSAGLVITVPPPAEGWWWDQLNVNGARPDPANSDPGRAPSTAHRFPRNLNDRLYFHSFSSIAVPTDSRDVVWMMNSIGLGWYLYRNPCDSFSPAVILDDRTAREHAADDRGRLTLPIGANDQLTRRGVSPVARSVLGFAVCVPLVAPRPYNIEMMANYTLRF